jgi:hypothetical protein
VQLQAAWLLGFLKGRLGRVVGGTLLGCVRYRWHVSAEKCSCLRLPSTTRQGPAYSSPSALTSVNASCQLCAACCLVWGSHSNEKVYVPGSKWTTTPWVYLHLCGCRSLGLYGCVVGRCPCQPCCHTCVTSWVTLLISHSVTSHKGTGNPAGLCGGGAQPALVLSPWQVGEMLFVAYTVRSVVHVTGTPVTSVQQ